MPLNFVVFFTILASFLCQCHGDILGREQSSGAKGILLCEGKPLAGVKVKLYDDDRGENKNKIN